LRGKKTEARNDAVALALKLRAYVDENRTRRDGGGGVDGFQPAEAAAADHLRTLVRKSTRLEAWISVGSRFPGYPIGGPE